MACGSGAWCHLGMGNLWGIISPLPVNMKWDHLSPIKHQPCQSHGTVPPRSIIVAVTMVIGGLGPALYTFSIRVNADMCESVVHKGVQDIMLQADIVCKALAPSCSVNNQNINNISVSCCCAQNIWKLIRNKKAPNLPKYQLRYCARRWPQSEREAGLWCFLFVFLIKK